MEILNKIFTNTENDLSLFTKDELIKLEKSIYKKDDEKYYIKSNSKGEQEKMIYSEKKTSPEEIVRQLYLNRLIDKYKYPKELIDVEIVVNFGREKKRADIIIYKEDKITPYILIEVKAPNVKNDVKQLKSYLNAEGAEIGIALNGQTIEILHRPYPKDFSTLPDIPEYRETVEDIYNKKFKYNELKEPKQLKQVIQNLEDLILANSGFDSFDEIFKIIYAKLFDEIQGRDDEDYILEFRARKDPKITKQTIDELFNKAKKEWRDIFDNNDKIKLTDTHLANIVANLQEYKLLGSNLQIIDDAFEYLIPDVAKGKKGQYFTPRHVIDMCVKMLNPKKDEFVIDTACGSGGFLIHTMKYVNPKNLSRYASKHLWGIDFDERSSKISKAMMLISGEGNSHIFKENSLDSSSWSDNIRVKFKDEELNVVIDENLKPEVANVTNFKHFNFDILLANPPFAGEVTEKHILSEYPNVVKEKQTKISRHLLFIERNLNFVKDGGRLALVLPQGVFNNTSEKYIRDFLADKARILAVVGLDVNTFKPHTGTKTSVIFLQKWDEEKCPKVADYPIFFAVSEKSGKDNSGEYVYKEVDGKRILQHDLNEIADEFVEWAKSEGLGFWKDGND